MAQIASILEEYDRWLRQHANPIRGWTSEEAVASFLDHIEHTEWLRTTGVNVEDQYPEPEGAGVGVLPPSPETESALEDLTVTPTVTALQAIVTADGMYTADERIRAASTLLQYVVAMEAL